MLIEGDCLKELGKLGDNSIDSLITDPPAGISFMGKEWDKSDGFIPYMTEIFEECLRVLKPGAHGFVWAIPRTSHWTATALEDAGFEIRDVVTHIFGSGFPKSSALNRQKKDAFCQCVSSTHNNDHNILLPHEHGHNGKAYVSVDDDLHVSNAQHSMNKHANFQDDCHSSYDSCDAHAHSCLKDDQAFFQQLEYAQEHIHFVALSDVQASESLHNPCQAQHIDRPSNQDCFHEMNQKMNISENNTSLHDVLIRKHNAQNSVHIDHNLRSQYPCNSYNKFPFECKACGKPDPKGWYNGGLKPASEHWILVRKPISEKTVAANVLKHGVGGINIDASRIDTQGEKLSSHGNKGNSFSQSYKQNGTKPQATESHNGHAQGRFPANLVLSHNSDCDEELPYPHASNTIWKCTPGCAVAELDKQSGILKQGVAGKKSRPYGDGNVYGTMKEFKPNGTETYKCDIPSGASRFFYCAKASKSDKGKDNIHPTVKSTKLMQYLITMITPPKGTVLDPFMGSGSTGVAAIKNGFNFIGIEKDAEYFKIAEKRIGYYSSID